MGGTPLRLPLVRHILLDPEPNYSPVLGASDSIVVALDSDVVVNPFFPVLVAKPDSHILALLEVLLPLSLHYAFHSLVGRPFFFCGRRARFYRCPRWAPNVRGRFILVDPMLGVTSFRSFL
ncbi:Type IV secretory pathway VirB4 component [Sesbania bispinosa]|nr:Type IV secretory pathway VirB4 component [Sesbania bispinosa]